MHQTFGSSQEKMSGRTSISTISAGRLYLGNLAAARDRELLDRLHIGVIINAAAEIPPADLPGVVVHHIPLVDSPNQDVVPELFQLVFDIIDDALDRGIPVLVHCAAGRSRSPLLVVAYLLHAYGLSVDEALRYVGKSRPEININLGFLGLLLREEPGLKSGRVRRGRVLRRFEHPDDLYKRSIACLPTLTRCDAMNF